MDSPAPKVTLTNADKVLYPETGTTKADVFDYYTAIAEVMVPHIAGRPATRKRWPNGVDRPSFFEKQLASSAPDWLGRGAVVHKSGTTTYPVIDSVAGLAWIAQQASLEVHVPQWRFVSGVPGPATRLVFDLDPGAGVSMSQLCEVACAVRDLMDDVGLATFPLTSGSKGLHLYARFATPVSSRGASTLAKRIAQQLEQAMPDLVTSTMTKSLRHGRILLDWSQNSAAKTTIAPYSLRGRAQPTVAAPRSWAEIEAAREGSAMSQLRYDEVLAGLVDGGGIQLDGLQELALADPSGQPWPTLDPAVYRYLQDATGGQLPSGVQRRYWSSDAAVWPGIYAAVVGVRFEDGHGFDSATFAKTHAELLTELRTVMTVRSRMGMYKQVYADAKWGDLTTTRLIRDTLAHQNQENVQFSLAKMFVSILRLAIPFAGEVSEAVSTALELSATSLETAEWTGAFEAADPRPSYVDISLAASQLGVKLNEAADETAAVYDRYGELILSDPAKFAAVQTWTCADGSASPRAWCAIVDTAFQTTLRATIARADERLAWTTLGPLVYAVYDLGVSPHTDLSEYACGTFSSRVTGGVFGDLEPETREASTVRLMRNTGKLPRMDASAKPGQPWAKEPEYHIFVMGMPVSGTPWHTFPSSGGRNWPREVEGDLLHRLFDPVAAQDDDPRMGGLGIDKRELIPSLRYHNSLDGWDWCGIRGSSE